MPGAPASARRIQIHVQRAVGHCLVCAKLLLSLRERCVHPSFGRPAEPQLQDLQRGGKSGLKAAASTRQCAVLSLAYLLCIRVLTLRAAYAATVVWSCKSAWRGPRYSKQRNLSCVPQLLSECCGLCSVQQRNDPRFVIRTAVLINKARSGSDT